MKTARRFSVTLILGIAALSGSALPLLAQQAAPIYPYTGDPYFQNNSGNVKDWGAVGDGFTDDTAAIQLALTNSRAVYFPPGTYLVSARLDIMSNGQHIYGEGPASIIKKVIWPGQPVTQFDLIRGWGMNDLSVENLTFEGLNDTTTAGVLDNSALNFTLSNRIVVKGCSFNNFGGVDYGQSLWFNGGDDFLVQGNHFAGGIGGASADIYFNGLGYTKIVVTDNTLTSPNSNGIGAAPCGVYNNNRITGKRRHGIITAYYSGFSTISQNLVVSGNNISNCGWSGIYSNAWVSTTTPTKIGRVLITGNFIRECGGNYSAGGNPGAIAIDGVQTPIEISGNFITRTSKDAEGSVMLPGINVTNADDALISGNTIEEGASYGISILKGRRIQVRGNSLINNTTAQIAVSGGCVDQPPENVQIVGNSLMSTVSGGNVSQVYMACWDPNTECKVLIADNAMRGPGTETNDGTGLDLVHPVVGLIQGNTFTGLRMGIKGNSHLSNRMDGSKLLVANNVFNTCNTAMGIDTYNRQAIVLQNTYTALTGLKFTDQFGAANPWIFDAVSSSPRVNVYAGGPPVWGTWAQGDQVTNIAPALGQRIGWMCTAGGTPGTWLPMPNL